MTYLDEYTHETIISDSGDYRARIVLDAYADMPEFDGACPVLTVDTSNYATRVELTRYGLDSDAKSGINADGVLGYFVTEFGVTDGVEAFDRYLRVFHGGRARAIEAPSRITDATHVAYTTTQMARDSWGCNIVTEETLTPEADEYVAWLRGNVWGIVVERRIYDEHDIDSIAGSDVLETPTDDWDEVDSCWGFYEDLNKPGKCYTIDEARAMLAHFDIVTKTESEAL